MAIFGGLNGPVALSVACAAAIVPFSNVEMGAAALSLSTAGIVGVELFRRPISPDGKARWDLFGVANVCAVTVFLASAARVINDLGGLSGAVRALLVPAIAFQSPTTATALLFLLVSTTYLTGYVTVGLAGMLLEVPKAEKSAKTATSLASEHRAAIKASSVDGWSTLGDDRDADVVIVGAGTAGAALATVLGRRGRRVLLVEPRLQIPHRVVGELMQPGGIRCLERLGLGRAAKCAAVDGVRVDGYVCVPAGAETTAEDVVLTYPDSDPGSSLESFGVVSPPSGGEGGVSKSPDGVDEMPRGRSFHNHRFVHELRRLAVAEPNVRLLVGRAQKLVETNGRVIGVEWSQVTCDENDGVETKELLEKSCNAKYVTKKALRAPLTVVCDGSASAFRGKFTEDKPQVVSYFCGLLLNHPHMETPLPHPHRGHVIMTQPSPVLLYQISPTETRVLVDVPAEVGRSSDVSDLKNWFRTRVAPQMPKCLRQPFLDAVNSQDPDVCSNRALPAKPPQKPGAVLLGDAWNMRHPLTGGGMTVALRDVETLADQLHTVSDLSNTDALSSKIKEFARIRRHHASVVNILANALHRVFSAPDGDDGTRVGLRDACIHYLGMGGPFSQGPIGLLAGLTPSPAVLATHYVLVALDAIQVALFPFPTPQRILKAYRILHIACMIIMPLLHLEQATFLAWPPVQFVVQLLFPWKHITITSLG